MDLAQHIGHQCQPLIQFSVIFHNTVADRVSAVGLNVAAKGIHGIQGMLQYRGPVGLDLCLDLIQVP
jgi:hypothetical protein